ncbi:MAG: hypothetical protein N3G78_04900 [Desulfobacterota bacterium]|nr:hypothetical protein [Thermodesulfobacteriota bacterium]
MKKEQEKGPGQEKEAKGREIDLNLLFPGRDYDLNRLFPDEGMRRLLVELKRNRREIDRFIKGLRLEEE